MITSSFIIAFWILINIKHLIIDFFWQFEDEWQYKGIYGHWGGIKHSLKHSVASFLCILTLYHFYGPISWGWLFIVCLLEFICHYHIDWLKMNTNRKFGWKSDTHPEFWYALGVDQFLHQLTYVAMLILIIF